MKKPLRSWLKPILWFALSLPVVAQTNHVVFFGGAILGTPTGAEGGLEAQFALSHNVSFAPSVALGRAGHFNLLTLDGTFSYDFHISDRNVVPYVLGGVGLSEWASATHGSPIIGGGARFRIAGGADIVPEVRVGDHGLSRFTIGIAKSF